jgi:hypothetical protein
MFGFNQKKTKSASDFWMADSYAMKTRTRDEDVMELASYRRAVANFVRIVTGDNIPVKYHTGDDSSTNGKTVTISASTKLEERDVMVGLALHEGSHIKLTDFRLVNAVFNDLTVTGNMWLRSEGYMDRAIKMCQGFAGSNNAQWDRYTLMQNFKDVFNYVEDRRIDNFIMTSAPGYMPYYQALYDKYFNSAIITKGLQSKDFRTEDWNSYMFRLMNITNPASDLKALKKLQQIWDVLDLDHIDRIQNSAESLALAFNITETIHDAIADQQKKEQEQQKQQDNNGDDKDDNKDDKQKDDKGNAKDSKSDDKNSKSDDKSDPMSSDADGEDSEEGDSDESGKGSKSKGNDKKEKKKESGKNESDSEDDSEDQGEGEDDDSKGSGGVGDEEGDEEGDQSDEHDDEEGDDEEGEGEGEGEGEAKEEKELPELSKADAGRLTKQIKEQKAFQSGYSDKKKLSKGTADTINAIDDSDIAIANVSVAGGYGASGSTEKVIVVRKFNRKLAETTDCSMWYTSPNRSHAEAVADGIRMGTVLGKKLKVRAEERSTKFNRLRSGKIDKRMISQAGYGAEGIFEKIESFAYRPGIIHMSIDSSGSMSGSKFKRSLICAAAIAKACSMIENMDCVISFRSTGNIGKQQGNSNAMIVVAYDSTRQGITDLKTLLPHMSATGGTPEGLCFDALMNDILGQAKGKDAYFVNFSDGQPYHGYNYHGSTAVQHTRKQVNKMITNGMKVISYFISESSASRGDSDTFRDMYGKDAQFIDVKSINAVAKTMNDKFLEINNA